jgi:Glycosyl transferase family 2
MTTVGLVLIARDEAHIIARAIESARTMVDMTLVVVDEASTDDTAAVCERLGANVIVRPFPGSIAAARNEAMDLAAPRVDYQLVLDPDDVLEGSLPASLQADVYKVWIHDGARRFPRIQLFKSSAGVRYEGIRHEYAVAPKAATLSMAASLIYKRIGGGYQDSLGQREKFMRHVRDLLQWTAAHPDDARSVTMLAQSYRDAGEVELARQEYERRLTMGRSDDEESYLTALEIAFLVEHHGGATPEAVMSAYLRCHEMQPLHAEPLFHLACYLREHDAVASAWHFARRAAELEMPTLATLVDVEVYEWKARAELAVESWLLGDRATAMKLFFEIAHERPEYKEWADEQLALVSTQDPPERQVGWSASQTLATTRIEVT